MTEKYSRRDLFRKTGFAVGTVIGVGATGWGIFKAVELSTPPQPKSPKSVEGYWIQLQNNSHPDNWSSEGQPEVVESGAELTETVKTKQGETKVGIGIRIATVLGSNGQATIAFVINTPEGEKQWLPINPSISLNPEAAPYILIVTEGRTTGFPLYVHYQRSKEGKDEFKLYPTKFNRGIVSNPVSKQP